MEIAPGKNCKKWHLNWKELSHHNFLPHRIYPVVEYYFAQGAKNLGEPNVSAREEFLAKLIAEEVKCLIEKGESDHAIALVFGTEGHWLDRAFLNTLRSITDGHRTVARDSNSSPEKEQ